MNRKLLGVKLKERRKEIKESMESLADGMISSATIGNIERGLPNVSEEKAIYYAEKIGLGKSLFGIISTAEKKEQETEAELSYLEDVLSADFDQSLQKLEGELSFVARDSRLSPLYHFLVGRCYFEKKAWNLSEKHFKKMLSLVEKTPERDMTNLKASSLNELGRIYYYRNNIEKALSYTKKGLAAFIEGGDRKENRFYLLINQATYQEKLDEDEEALKTLEKLWNDLCKISGTKVLTILRTDTILQMYITFVIILNKAKHYTRALEFVDEGVAIARSNQSFDRLITLWTTAGVIHENMGELDEAERFYLMALAIKEKVVNRERLAYPLTNLGLLYLKTKKYEMVKKLIEEAISITDNDVSGKIESLVVLGDCYLEQEFFQEAIKPYNQAASLSEKNGLLKKQYEITTNLCYCYFKIKNSEAYMKHLQRMFQHKIRLSWDIDIREGYHDESSNKRTN
jgi:tetratricopeptide (TPR) repeat protein